MIDFIIGYTVANSNRNARDRRQNTPEGYEVFEFFVITGTILIGILWSIHLGFLLTQWKLHIGWAITIATLAGFIALATGAGYLIVGIIYAIIWLGILIERGKAAEASQFM
jgi:hypothetical protein